MLVNARPGVDRRQLRETLQDLHAAAINLRSVSTAGDRFGAYLVWVASAVRVLRGPAVLPGRAAPTTSPSIWRPPRPR